VFRSVVLSVPEKAVKILPHFSRMWLSIKRVWKTRELLSNRSRPFSHGDWGLGISTIGAPSDHPNWQLLHTTIRPVSGFSNLCWLLGTSVQKKGCSGYMWYLFRKQVEKSGRSSALC